MSDPVYLLHLVMYAIIATAIFCMFILQRREAEADVQRVLDGLDAAVQAQNEFVDFYAEQHRQLVTELASQMHEQIKASELASQMYEQIKASELASQMHDQIKASERQMTTQVAGALAAWGSGYLNSVPKTHP